MTLLPTSADSPRLSSFDFRAKARELWIAPERYAIYLGGSLYLAGLLATLAVIVGIWGFFLSTSGYVDYVEGLVLFHQRQAAAGENIYSPLFRNAPPYSIPLYGPVFYYLGGLFVASDPSLLPGRIISLIALCTVSATSWAILRRRFDASAWVAAVGVLPWLITRGTFEFGVNNRTDSLAAAFGILSLLVGTSPLARLRYATVPLLLLAGFTKPTAAVAPGLAVFLALVFEKRYRDASLLALSTLLLTAAVLGLGDLLCEGNFTRSLIFSNANPLLWDNLESLTKTVCKSIIVPIGIVSATLLLAENRTRPFGFHALLALLFAMATSAKVGANVNYFIEPCWAVCFCLAIFLSRWQHHPRAAIVMGLVGVLMIQSAARMGKDIKGKFEQVETWPRLLHQVDRLGQAGPLLTMETGALAMLGQTPYIADPHIITRLAEAGQFDDSEIVNDLRKQRFAAVIAADDIQPNYQRHTNWTQPVRQLVATHYQPSERLGDLVIYLPRDEPLTQPVPLATDPVQDGIHRKFYANGQIAVEQEIKDEEKHGLERCWSEQGQLVSEFSFRQGEKHGTAKTWHPNGQQASLASYEHDERHGVETTWHANGNLWTKVEYLRGSPHGIERRWNSHGVPLPDRVWESGRLKLNASP